MARKTLLIAFPLGGIIAAEIANKKEDVQVDPHEPVRVPVEYGESLIADKFAYEAQPKGKQAPANETPDPEKLKKLEAAVAAAQKAVDGAKSEPSKAKAQKYLASTEKALAAAKA
ncbi:MAG: hypothetical protein ABJL55_16360 [Roseibium sp.]